MAAGKVSLKRNLKEHNAFTLTLKDFTAGKLSVLYRAIKAEAERGSVLACELRQQLKPAFDAESFAGNKLSEE